MWVLVFGSIVSYAIATATGVRQSSMEATLVPISQINKAIGSQIALVLPNTIPSGALPYSEAKASKSYTAIVRPEISIEGTIKRGTDNFPIFSGVAFLLNSATDHNDALIGYFIEGKKNGRFLRFLDGAVYLEFYTNDYRNQVIRLCPDRFANLYQYFTNGSIDCEERLKMLRKIASVITADFTADVKEVGKQKKKQAAMQQAFQ